MDDAGLKSLQGGKEVVILQGEMAIGNVLWVGDQWVKPKVAFRLYTNFSPADLERIRVRRMEKKARADSPVLFTSL